MMYEFILFLKFMFSQLFNFKTNKPITYGPLAVMYNYKTFSQK